MKSIREIIDKAARAEHRTLAVAAAHGEDVLRAVAEARKTGLISAILVGDKGSITGTLRALGEDLKDYQVVDAPLEECAAKAVSFITSGDADFLMKGLIGTADMMRAVMDRDNGVRTGSLISHVMIYEAPGHPRLLALTDGGVNTFPDLEKKALILENAAAMLRKMGYDEIVAACICGAEVVEPKIQSTLDAAELVSMDERWRQYNMHVIGPVGLDLAISEDACKHKGYRQEYGGKADILLVPSYEVGNGIGKALTYFAGARSAGIILGAQVPIVLVSRADESQTKLASIALGCILSSEREENR